MSDKERGRLFSIRIDGSDSMPFVIKKDKLLFGRSDCCEIRIYVDGVAPEHCIVTFNEEGRGFVEPVNKVGLIFLNGKPIERQVSLEHNDVITVVKRSFRFFYPASSKYFESCLSIASSDEIKVGEQSDFNMNLYKKKEKEICGKRVTFGPSLSPEEFDKNLPPASPLRRGSLPGEKCKTKTPCRGSLPGGNCRSILPGEKSNGSEAQKLDIKRNRFNSDLLTKKVIESDTEQISSGNELPKSAFNVLKSVNPVGNDQQPVQSIENVKHAKPLFSDVLKSHISKAKGNLTAGKTLQKSSPRLLKKSVELQHTKRPIYGITKKPVNPRVLAVGSTGHANSPETIVICKRREKCTPTPTNKKVSDVQQKNENVTSSSSALERDDKSEERDYSEEGAVIQDSDSEECAEMNNSKSNENLTECQNLSSSGEKFKKVSCEGDKSINKRAEEVQTTTSSLAAAMNNFHSANYAIGNSLNNFQNTTETSSYLSNLPLNLSKESSNNCLNTVQNLALTISMINAYHMYNRIMDDISSFPLCFPSTSFETFKDIKSIQKSSSQQSGEQGDNSRLMRFQDIMQNFFSSNDFKDDKDGILRSSGNNLNTETSLSVCNRMQESEFASETQVHFKAIDSVCSSESEIDYSQHDIDLWIDKINKTDEVELENNTNKCNECKMTANLCTCLQNSYNISVENNVELNFSKTSSMISNEEYCSYNSPEENVYFSELPYSCDATQQNTSLNSGSKTINISFEKIDTDSKTRKNIASKRKSVNVNKRSLRPRLFRQKRSISSSETLKKSLDKSQSIKSFRNLHSRHSLILKTKRRKVSLVQEYGLNASRKVKTMNSKKLNANHPEGIEFTTKYLEEYDSNEIDIEEQEQVKNEKKRKLRSDAPEIDCMSTFSEVPCKSKKSRKNATNNKNEQKAVFVKGTECEGKKIIKTKHNLKKTNTSDGFHKNSEVECKEMLAEISSNSKKRRRGNTTDLFSEHKESSVQGAEYVGNKEIKKKRNMKSKNIPNKSDVFTSSEVESKDNTAKIPCNSTKRKRGKNTKSFSDEQKDILVKGIEFVENKEVKSKRVRSVKKTNDKSESLKISGTGCKGIFSEIPCDSKRGRRKKNAADNIKEQKDLLVKGKEFVENKEVKSKRARSVKTTNDKSESLKISETECRGIFSEIPYDSKRGRRKKNAADNIEEQKDHLVEGMETEENRRNRNLKNTGNKLDLKISEVECKEIFTEMPCDSKRGRKKKATNNINEHKDHSIKGTTCEENEGIKKTRKKKFQTTSKDLEVLQEMEVQRSPKKGRRRRNDKVEEISLKEKKSLIPKDKGKKQTKSSSDQSIVSPVQPKKRNRIR